jgi:aryl-phospho-beta-D-glucosidase BglC (GH1 family)
MFFELQLKASRVLILFGCLLCACKCDAFDWSQARGFNVTPNVELRDFVYLRSLGVSVVRVSFADDPLLQNTVPYAFNRSALDRLDQIVEWANDTQMALVIDPHTAPGFRNKYTTSPDDSFWTDPAKQERFVLLWSRLAQRYGVETNQVIGFDLLNEPVVPNSKTAAAPFDWNKYVDRLVRVIRQYDKIHTIIIQPARRPDQNGVYNNVFEALEDLRIPNDKNVVVSPHMYLPVAFTHQGAGKDWSRSAHYPGVVDGNLWDRNAIASTMSKAWRFGKLYKVPIFIGEFSASAKTGLEGVQYLRDVVETMNQLSMGWAYHAYKENPIWDPQLDSSGTGLGQDRSRSRATVLLRGLKGAMQRDASHISMVGKN